MSTVDVHTPDGATSGTTELPAELFDVTANIPLIHQVVVAQLAAARQGTHATKTRGDVRGGGKKPYRQKGTGRARQGSTRSPQFAGGGVAHGPQPHGYAQRTPKKMIAAALRGAGEDDLVAPDANKTEIKIAVESVFDVKVTGVNTLNRQGKKRRTRSGTGKRSDTKRAIVSVADGQRIDIFSAPAS